MQNKIVVDTSAIIALINREKGAEIVEKHLDSSIISSVNFSELLTVLQREVFKDSREFFELIKSAFLHIENFDSKQAEIAASLDKITKDYGLSLGDRACLALAKSKNLPVLTADKAWKSLEIGVKIQLIR